ncbi:TonB-dependent receptor [Christiangramia portivictoriae]|uniref:TonB-dependent receptor n=1 Tax=Christiangramia portivictoriae TaxID=326069 RepID=UPI00047C28B2|nr:TonB-dependent receptor [Christiangramia portivictoriae]
MRNIKLLALLLAVQSILYGQNSLSGKISDQDTKEPVFSANVYFPALERGTMTDLDGNFTISDLPNGNFKMVISSIGYASYTQEVVLPSQNLSIALKPSAIEMEEVIVSTPFHQLQSDNVMKVERESVSELSKNGAVNLSEGITQIAGVDNLTTGLGIGKPVIRGLSSNRVLVYTQGVRLENQQYGDEHGLGISSKGIASVEVIKGPASLLYGSDAIGGVLYLNPERYATENSLKASVEADYFSNTLGHQTSLMASTSGKQLKFIARGSYAAHSDYETGEGERITNTRFNDKDIKAGIGFQNSAYKGDLRYNFNNSEIGIPEEMGVQSTSKEPLLPYQNIDNHILSLDNKFYLNNSSIDLKVGYQFNDRQEFEDHHHHEDHEGEEHDGEEHEEHEGEHEEHDGDHEEHEKHEGEEDEDPALEMHLETLNYNLKYNFPKFENLDVIAGVQGMWQSNENFGEEILIPDATTTDFGVFATAHYHLPKIDFQGGIRYDNRSIETESYIAEDGDILDEVDREFNSFNGAIGAKMDITENLTTRLNLASGFRAPNLSELTSNGSHNGANRYEIGNPNLDNEQNFQIDLAVEWRNQHFEAFANGFTNSVNNYIYISPSGEILDNEEVFRYLQDDARLYGGEIGVHLHPHPLDWLHLESSFETVIGKLDDDTYLPLIPANTLTNTFRVEFNEWRLLTGSYSFISLKNVFDQENPGSFETRTGGYSLVNLGAGTEIKTNTALFELRLSVNNLFDKDYFSHLSRLKNDGLSNIGRNLMLSANIHI